MRGIHRSVLFLFVPLALTAQQGTGENLTRQKIFRANDAYLTFKTENLEQAELRNAAAIRLQRFSDRNDDADDLHLDFESDFLFTNPAYRNLVLSADFERLRQGGMSGKSARFNGQKNVFRLKLPPHLNLSGATLTPSAGDFSFSCEFKAKAANGGILRRENFFGGRQYLFAVSLINNRVVVDLNNILQAQGANGQTLLESVTLTAIDKLRAGGVNRLLITYEEGAGRLALYVNGREQKVVVLKRDASAHFVVDFTKVKNAPLVLFGGFLGFADNVIFTNRILSSDDTAHFGAIKPYGDRYAQRHGVLHSDIFDMRYSESSIVQITAQSEIPAEAALRIEARCANRRFDAMLPDRALRFEKISRLADRRCRFVQFRADFTADNAGEKSPLLASIALEFRENPPPNRPLKPKILSVVGDSVELELTPNVELDVVKGGRYIIYYGHAPLKAEGAIYFAATDTTGAVFRGEPIRHKVPIRVRINYDTIAQNKAWADQNPRFKRRYPVFENGIGFYFWVTACDNAYGAAQELQDHESAPSEPVFVRFGD